MSAGKTGLHPDRVLIVRLSHLGDIVHTLPLLSALREAYSKAHIAWLVEDPYALFVSKLVGLDETVTLPRHRLSRVRPAWKRPRVIWDLVRRLRSRRFQVSIDVHGLTKSAIWGVLAGARMRIGFGGQNGRELSRWLNNTLVLPDTQARHVVDCNLSLLQPLGINRPSVRFDVPAFRGARERICAWLKERCGPERPCVISPGAGWETKRWPAERYGALATALAKEVSREVVVLWGPGEEPLRNVVLAASRSSRVHAAPPTGIPEMTELIRLSQVVITNDTGPLHLAAAIGVPTVSIFGPSDPVRNGPYGECHRVVRAEVPCLNCWKARCPAVDQLACMRSVTVQAVLRAVTEVLA